MTKATSQHIRSISAGQRFHRLTAVEPAGYKTTATYKKILWRFRCDCGNDFVTVGEGVKSGNTKSCGCWKLETSAANGRANVKHGLEGTRIYQIWNKMIHRCESPNDSKFEYYGGRGITVCEEWHSVEKFHEWALANGYENHLTIDRYPDKDGNYEPNNCRWATWSEQQYNRRPRRWRKRPPTA